MTRGPTARAVDVAKDLGVDLDQVTGSGKDGRITVGDVRAKAQAEAGGVPPDLGERGRQLWGDVKTYLEDLDLWRAVHADLLERYVRNLIRSSTARVAAEANPTVLGSTGQTVANPMFRVARDAELDAHKYAEALLLTPAALRRHLAGAEDSGDGDLGF